jgi:tetratricopeptide (TPR) repeat protein
MTWLYHFILKPMLHESYLSPDDYPTWLEHLLAPTYERLAGIEEQVQRLARELPLAEAAELLGPCYPGYLRDMFEYWVQNKQPTQALSYAEALISYDPQHPEYREMRIWCRTQCSTLDYAALLADYDWLSRQPLLGYEHWLRMTQDANPASSEADNAEVARWEHGRDLIMHASYCLGSAWASFNLGELEAADDAFGRCFARPPHNLRHGYDHETWRVGLLPPVPDPTYLRWQLEQPDFWPFPVQQWAGLALVELKRMGQ